MPYVMKLVHPNGSHLYVHGPEPYCRCSHPGTALRMDSVQEWRAWWVLHHKSIMGEAKMVRVR